MDRAGLASLAFDRPLRIARVDNDPAVEETIMRFRRIVTGHDASGKSVFAITDTMRQDEAEHLPGFASALVWATPRDAVVPDSAAGWREGQSSFHPAPGETRFLVVTFPPDSVMTSGSFDPVAAGNEQLRLSPGIAERFEAGDPGMHTTETIDYGVVLSGEIWLEVDDGEQVHLKQHDVIIQNGTRHAWRNKGNAPATAVFVLVGAERKKV
jgi:mannose-6-phosphate isomerase-like protein (cupin superfamily)